MQIKLFLYEELNALLLRVPFLIKQYELGDSDFTEQVLTWLRSIEDLLQKNNCPLVSKLSITKGKLISVMKGTIPGDIQLNKKMSVSKIKQVYALNLIGETSNILSGIMNPVQQRILESENLIKHMLAIAYQKNILKEFYTKNNSNKDVRVLYSAMNNDVDLNPWITKLNSLMGMYEALIILDRSINDFI